MNKKNSKFMEIKQNYKITVRQMGKIREEIK